MMKFENIPEAAHVDSRMIYTSRLVLSVICTHLGMDGISLAPIAVLADQAEMREDTLWRWIDELMDTGYLVRKQDGPGNTPRSQVVSPVHVPGRRAG